MLQVSTNGLILFDSSLPSPLHYRPTFLPLAGEYRFVAPFWADIDTTRPRNSTAIWGRETNSSAILKRAREDIQTAFKTPVNFQPQFAFIATWNQVEAYNSNTSQVSTQIIESIYKPCLEFFPAC